MINGVSHLRSHIVIHDYAGHPFTVEFARALAKNGQTVTYLFFGGDEGPKGRNQVLPDDPANFNVVPINISGTYSKTNFIKRRFGDIEYGKNLRDEIIKIRPTLVISGNTPTETQEYLLRACKKIGAKFIYWCQDFYSIAAGRILERKLPIIGSLIGRYYTFLERRQMRLSDHVVHITEKFCETTDKWGIPRSRVSIVPNWGLIDEIQVLDRDTDWAKSLGLKRPHRIIYSGTLATKHNPELLRRTAASLQDEADMVVVGFGSGADALAADSIVTPNLKVLPLQSFSIFPEVLASADVLVAVIERDAGEFSVPSKVLSYLCAGRPIVLAAPRDNLASQILLQSGAGCVVEPEDLDGFKAQVQALISDEGRRCEMGARGRRYAEASFSLDGIVARFQSIFSLV